MFNKISNPKQLQAVIGAFLELTETPDEPDAMILETGLQYRDSSGVHCTMSYPYKPDVYPYRSRYNHPYSYSPLIIWGSEPEVKVKVAYSHTIYRKKYKLATKLCETYFGDQGQYFNNRNPALIQKWLARLLKKKIKLHMIVEWCDASNGYPHWSFHYTNE